MILYFGGSKRLNVLKPFFATDRYEVAKDYALEHKPGYITTFEFDSIDAIDISEAENLLGELFENIDKYEEYVDIKTLCEENIRICINYLLNYDISAAWFKHDETRINAILHDSILIFGQLQNSNLIKILKVEKI